MLSVTIKKASVLKKIATILNNLFHTISIHIKEGLLLILMVTTCKYMLFDIAIELDSSTVSVETTFSVNAKHFLESFNTLRANDAVCLHIRQDQLTVQIHWEQWHIQKVGYPVICTTLYAVVLGLFMPC